jgi:Peptidase A4 family
MGRKSAMRMGVLPTLVLGLLSLGGLDTGSAWHALPGAAETHAPWIPGPGPTTPGRAGAQVFVSKNWSGYVQGRAGVTSASGSWRVPTVQTPTKKRLLKKSTFSSSWVGVDGFGNSSLIQAGTEQDWLHGSAFYQAWWEILPYPETPIPSLTVRPGDTMSVHLTQDSPGVWTIAVADITTSQSVSIVQSYRGPGTSVEWIQEAPTLGRRLATLATDSTVVFDHGTVNGAGPALTSPDAVYMIKGRVSSTPSTPDSDQDGFAVAYGPVGPPTPSS